MSVSRGRPEVIPLVQTHGLVYGVILSIFCTSASSCLSSSLLPSSFVVSLSSYTRRRQFLSKALVYYCFLVFRGIGQCFPRSVLFCQPHQQLFIHLTERCLLEHSSKHWTGKQHSSTKNKNKTKNNNKKTTTTAPKQPTKQKQLISVILHRLSPSNF